MNVYIKNQRGEQTVRYIPFHTAIWLRIKMWLDYPNVEDRPIIRFLF